jgi:cytochrome c oxidase subunit 1
MPRRYAIYSKDDGFTLLNQISSFGSLILGLSTLVFIYNVFYSSKAGKKTKLANPWHYGRSLEWVTPTPPPHHNFDKLPLVRSQSPAFDILYDIDIEKENKK